MAILLLAKRPCFLGMKFMSTPSAPGKSRSMTLSSSFAPSQCLTLSSISLRLSLGKRTLPKNLLTSFTPHGSQDILAPTVVSMTMGLSSKQSFKISLFQLAFVPPPPILAPLRPTASLKPPISPSDRSSILWSLPDPPRLAPRPTASYKLLRNCHACFSLYL